jgi:uncharacterized Zn finger protein
MANKPEPVVSGYKVLAECENCGYLQPAVFEIPYGTEVGVHLKDTECRRCKVAGKLVRH